MMPEEAARIAAQEQEWRAVVQEWAETVARTKARIDSLYQRLAIAEKSLTEAEDGTRFWAAESAGHELRAAAFRNLLQEWRAAKFFEPEAAMAWTNAFEARVDAALFPSSGGSLSERREEFKAQLAKEKP